LLFENPAEVFPRSRLITSSSRGVPDEPPVTDNVPRKTELTAPVVFPTISPVIDNPADHVAPSVPWLFRKMLLSDVMDPPEASNDPSTSMVPMLLPNRIEPPAVSELMVPWSRIVLPDVPLRIRAVRPRMTTDRAIVNVPPAPDRLLWFTNVL